jgi:tRNA(Ile)-lysidine synthetase-like protein
VRHAIRRAKGDLRGIDYSHIDEVVGLAIASKGSARRALPGLTVVRSFDGLLLRVPGSRPLLEPIRIETPGVYRWPPSKPLIQLAINVGIRNGEACDTLDLELRGWRAGDEYRPVGHRQATKLQELFQKARIPSWKRASWPIVTGKGKVLWAKEFGLAADHPGLSIREIPFSG